MLEEDIQYFENVTYRFKQLHDTLYDISDILTEETIARSAFSRIKTQAMLILASNLNKAIGQSGGREYLLPEFSQDLTFAFSNPKILVLDPFAPYERKINIDAEGIVGTKQEFWAGIEEARKEVGVVGRMSPAASATFWKYFIYMPARENTVKFGKRKDESDEAYNRRIENALREGKEMYDATIKARKSAWKQGKAPYWIWLEYGTGQYAYPQQHGTGFIKDSQKQINILLEREIKKVRQGTNDVLDQELNNFLYNPEEYKPGQIIREFVAYIQGEARTVYVYKTPLGRLGAGFNRPRYAR